MSYIQSNDRVILPVFAAGAATQTLSAADSGKVHFLQASTAAGVLNLPAARAGLRYKLIVTATQAFTVTVTAPVVNTIIGSLLVTNTGAGDAVTNVIKAGTTTFVITATATSSDSVEIICNGVTWYVNGLSRAIAGFA